MTIAFPRKGQQYAFSDYDFDLIESVTARRMDRSSGLGPGHGEVGAGVSRERNFNGAVGECAYARMIEHDWPHDENDWGARGDFEGVEVRTSKWSNGCLTIFDSDIKDRWFALVTLDSMGRVATYRGRVHGKSNPITVPPRVRSGSAGQIWVPQRGLE